MTVRVRRDTSNSGKTGWRWECSECPPIRPRADGTGGRPLGGFHWDDQWVFAGRRWPPVDVWRSCVDAALLHVHVYHHGKPPKPAR